jgi:hypothetical protein
MVFDHNPINVKNPSFYDKRACNETICNIEEIYGSSPLASMLK